METKDIPYKLITSHSAIFLQEGLDIKERNHILEKQSILSSNLLPYPSNIAEVIPMPWYEEAVVILFWGIFFGFMLYGPLVIVYLVIVKAYQTLFIMIVILSGISFLPVSYHKNSCYSYLFTLILKYHSHRGIWSEYIPTNQPVIIVGPPHGVFPFGSLLACISVPRTSGTTIRGIAATALLYVPIIGNFLRYIGVMDASRQHLKAYLNQRVVSPYNPQEIKCNAIGISSGGIAEIFRTNFSKDSIKSQKANSVLPKECILLKNRQGICKLALQTGAIVIPSYVFGNNQCFSVWYDSFGILETISRTLRVSICFFWGRWGLPIPYRVPILGVLGKPIFVEKVEDPSQEQIQKLLNELQTQVKDLFEFHKCSYGWKDVQLEIQ